MRHAYIDYPRVDAFVCQRTMCAPTKRVAREICHDCKPKKATGYRIHTRSARGPLTPPTNEPSSEVSPRAHKHAGMQARKHVPTP